MQTKRRWAPGHDARATHRAGALAGCIATLAVVLSVAACGHGSAVDPISVDADSAVVPRAVCGPGSSPETGLQGEVSRADRDSGRSAQGYRCNLELVGQYQGEGASWVNPSTSHCAYLSTSFLGVLRKASPGVQVIDVSDPAAPKLATHLTSASMLVGPWESLKVNEARGLLGAVSVGPLIGGLFFDIYDIAGDCTAPVHLNGVAQTGLELPANVLGHEGDFSPDGMTYWATGLALGAITAIDVSDPTQPRIVYTGIAGFPVNHGVEFSADGRRMYLATIFPGGVIAYDISDIQDRVPSPRIHELGRVSWNPTSAGQQPLRVSYDGHPYLFVSDEFGAGGVYLVDIADETQPTVVGQIRLEIQQPEHAHLRVDEAGANGLFGYEGHYCTVDRRDNPTALACGFFNSGIRVFDVRDPLAPREIAYFNPPAQAGKTAQLPSSEHAAGFALAPTLSDVPSALYSIGSYAIDLTKLSTADLSADWCSSPPRFVGNQLWASCQDNGFMVLRFTNDAYPLH